MTMKTLAILVPVVWLIAAPIVAQQPPAPTAAGTARTGQSPATFKTKKLIRLEVDQLLAKPSQVLILDVRRPDELMTIGGFPVYLSIQVADIENSLEWIPKDRTIVTVSNHANRGGRVGDLLIGRGFTVAGTIGAQDYESEGGQLTRIAPPKPADR